MGDMALSCMWRSLLEKNQLCMSLTVDVLWCGGRHLNGSSSNLNSHGLFCRCKSISFLNIIYRSSIYKVEREFDSMDLTGFFGG